MKELSYSRNNYFVFILAAIDSLFMFKTFLLLLYKGENRSLSENPAGVLKGIKGNYSSCNHRLSVCQLNSTDRYSNPYFSSLLLLTNLGLI